jgi:phosphohistidine phosphatase
VTHLYLLRHGDADHPGKPTWKSDSERPLTQSGIEKMRLEALGIKTLGLSFNAVISSPFLRARQTADQVAALYGLDVVESDLLEPGASFKDLARVVKKTSGEHIMVVGHAPDLSLLTGKLTGGGEIPLGKGSMAWVKAKGGALEEGEARLVALLPAEILEAVGTLTSRRTSNDTPNHAPRPRASTPRWTKSRSEPSRG